VTDSDFADWVTFHTNSTGASERVRLTVTANRQVFTGDWGATLAELCEVTGRLVKGKRLPKFPELHPTAIGDELIAIRTEIASAARATGEGAPSCPDCAGSGLVVVPHPKCVWRGRLVIDRLTRKVLTTSAVCCRPECAAGVRIANEEEARPHGKRRPLLKDCNRSAGCDLVELLRKYDSQEAERTRRELGPGPIAGLVGGMLSRMRAAHLNRGRDRPEAA